MKMIEGVFLCLAVGIIVVFGPTISEALETVTITDMSGRKVKVPKRIERVVPLGAALRYIVYLQAFDKVVGIEAFEKKNRDNPGRPYSLAIADRVDALPIIGEGGPNRAPDFERLISLRPDIVMAMGLDIALVENIQKKTAIPVVALSSGGRGMLDLEHVEGSLRLMGNLLDRGQRAEQLITFIKDTKKDLLKRAQKAKDRPSVYVGAVSFSGRHGITSTQGDYLPLQWIRGNNVAEQLGRKGPLFIDREKLLQWDPSVLFIDMGGIELIRDDYNKTPEFYRRLKAVKEGRVYSVMPFNFYHTNLEIALANSYYIGKVIYPAHFKEIEPAKRADEIFKTFVGVDAYERLKRDYHGFGKVYFGGDRIELR